MPRPRGSTTAGPPQLSRPLPANPPRHLRVPATTGGDSLVVPRVRPARARGATTSGLARIDEGSLDFSQVPQHQPGRRPLLLLPPRLPLFPRRPALPADPIARWLMEEDDDFRPEVARAVAPAAVSRPSGATTTTAALPPVPSSLPPAAFASPVVLPVASASRSVPVSPPKAARKNSSVSVTPTDVSRASSPGLPQEFPQPSKSNLISAKISREV